MDSLISVPYVVHCDLPHEDPRWVEARLDGIGASEMAILLGESHWSSPFELWAVKSRKIKARQLSAEEVRWGQILEPVILEEYRQRTGRRTRPEHRTFRSIEHPWALASLDGWTTDSDIEHPLELKATGFLLANEWVDGPPEKYRIQIHQQMLVTGAQSATICALIGGQKLAWIDVPRDETLIRKIIYHGQRFWNMVVDGTPPDVDGNEYTSKALGQVYPELGTSGTAVLSASFYDVFEELDAVKKSAKAAEERAAELTNRIKAAMGHSSRAILPNGWEATWITQNKRSYTVAASESRVFKYKSIKEKGKAA